MYLKVFNIRGIMKSAVFVLSAFMLITALVNLCSIASKVSSDLTDSAAPKIIIDAGHGGADGGASGYDGTKEKDLNLQVAKKLKEIMNIFGYNVIMTRTDDESTDNGGKFIKRIDIKNRLALMEKNRDAAFVSIHMNKFEQSIYWGAQTFYSKNNEKSKILAQYVQSSIIKFVQPENKREIKQSPSNVYLLKKANNPAIIVECGFLSNQKELELLKSEEYRSKLGFAIALGIMEYTDKSKD